MYTYFLETKRVILLFVDINPLFLNNDDILTRSIFDIDVFLRKLGEKGCYLLWTCSSICKPKILLFNGLSSNCDILHNEKGLRCNLKYSSMSRHQHVPFHHIWLFCSQSNQTWWEKDVRKDVPLRKWSLLNLQVHRPRFTYSNTCTKVIVISSRPFGC